MSRKPPVLPGFVSGAAARAPRERRPQAFALATPPAPAAPAMPGSAALRVLVRMATRSRPAQALAVLERYRRLAGLPVALEVVVDTDDATMLESTVLQRLAALDCTVTVGPHRSKVEAVNGGKMGGWDLLVSASDDMVPIASGYARRLVDAMGERFPWLDGALYSDDGHQGEKLCTLPVFGRRLFDQFGYVYFPGYRSFFCDQEQTELLHAMGRLAYLPDVLFEHRHPDVGLAPRDDLYRRNGLPGAADRELYRIRRDTRRDRARWGFDSPALLLTLAIATMPSRSSSLATLLRHLYAQADRRPRQVEILVEGGTDTTGAKRQRLLEKARGLFVAFVDDDDFVAHDYVERVCAAIEAEPAADCVSLVGIMTTNGAGPERFEHSIAHDRWFTRGGVHYRCPNHLNPVRLELARDTGFRSITIGEDRDFSERLRPLLEHEASTGAAPLYFYWFRTAEHRASPAFDLVVATVPWRRASCERLLRELARQDRHPATLHLVLDGFPEELEAPGVPRELEAKTKVVLHRFAAPQGAGNRWRVALRLAGASPYLANLDDDVRLTSPGFLRELLERAVLEHAVVGCGGHDAGGRYLASPKGRFEDQETDYLETGVVVLPSEFLVGIEDYGDVGDRALGLDGHDEALLSAHFWRTGRRMLMAFLPYAFDTRAAEDPRAQVHSRDPQALQQEISRVLGWRRKP